MTTENTSTPISAANRPFTTSAGVSAANSTSLHAPLKLRHQAGALWADLGAWEWQDADSAPQPVTRITEAGPVVVVETARDVFCITAAEYAEQQAHLDDAPDPSVFAEQCAAFELRLRRAAVHDTPYAAYDEGDGSLALVDFIWNRHDGVGVCFDLSPKPGDAPITFYTPGQVLEISYHQARQLAQLLATPDVQRWLTAKRSVVLCESLADKHQPTMVDTIAHVPFRMFRADGVTRAGFDTDTPELAPLPALNTFVGQRTMVVETAEEVFIMSRDEYHDASK